MRIFAFAVSAALVLGLAVAAQAHAFLDRADPRVGAVVAKPPTALRLTFTQGLEAVFCRVTVTGPPGFGGADAAHPVPGDPNSLTVDLHPPLPHGAYVVRWRVLSVDTHVTEGAYSFEVRP